MLHRSCTRYSLLTALFLFLTFFSSKAQANEHRVTLSGNGIPLKAVFKAIKKQTGFAVMYNTNLTMINQEEKVSVHFTATPLDEVLAFIFRGKNLEWSYNDDVLLIRKKETPPVKKIMDSTVTPALLTGKVTDAAGQPLIGATVQVKGGSQGTTTDEDGKFSLAKVGNGETLLISSVGYEKRELVVNGRSVLAQLNIDVNKLDETVVIAYGTTTQRLSTGNIASVKAKDIEKSPVNNPLLALQGRAPGIFIEQANGLPGTGVTVRIQGQNSISQGNEPLFVIDGVPYTSQLLPGVSEILGRSGGGGNGNPFSFINPADIESIDILKDADATAIYGSRAANGAVLITTKKGKAGKTSININLQQGWGKVTRKLPLLNTQQYLEMRHEAKRNDNAPINAADYDINGTWDTTRYTDWQKILIGGTAHYTDLQGSVSGGNTNTQFLIGAGFHRETTVFPGDNADQKASVHFNISNTSPNGRFRIQLTGSYMADNNRLIGTDFTRQAITLAPNAPALYNADGTLNWAPNTNGNSTWYNPLATTFGKYKNTANNLVGNAVMSYQILPGLDLKSSFGYTNLQIDEANAGAAASVAPEFRPLASRFSQFSNGHIRSWIIEPQITFKHSTGEGILETLVGTSIQQNNVHQQRFSAYGFNSDLIVEDISAASNLTARSSPASTYRYNGLFGRINYNRQQKYILNLTARRDGSSRFGSENLFHNFWSVAGAWLFSNEGFIKKHLSFLSFGKLRVSYGTTGNDQIGDYAFMTLYNTRTRNTPYQGATGLAPTRLPNPYLQWEETRKLQVGLDLGFLTDRVLLYANYYRNRSSNQLQNYALPLITGFDGIAQNFPATVQNSGWEFTLNTINLQSNRVSWTAAINFTVPKNKLVDYRDLATSTVSNNYIIGQPVTIVKLYQFAGVNPATGLYQYFDKDGKITSSPDFSTDRTEFINTAPVFYGGFQNSFSYKGFNLDVLFQFVRQSAYNYFLGDQPGRFLSDANGTRWANQPVYVQNRWQQQGDISTVQKYGTIYPLQALISYFSASSSALSYTNASYIRLKNLALSWQLPAHWRRSIGLQNARVYLQGQNLLTITNYQGLDPETKSATTLPPLRVLTLGAQITL